MTRSPLGRPKRLPAGRADHGAKAKEGYAHTEMKTVRNSSDSVIESQEEIAAEFDNAAIEIPPGRSQIKFIESRRQWVPRGQVLRCHIEDDERWRDGRLRL